METAIHAFLSYLRVEKGLAQNTILAYGRDLKRFAKFLGTQHKFHMNEVNREDIVNFLSSLYREKLDSRSVARYLVSLRNFYKYGIMEELVRTDPTENLESPKIRKSLPSYLRMEEVERLLGAPTWPPPPAYGTARCSKFFILAVCASLSYLTFAFRTWTAKRAVFVALARGIRNVSFPWAERQWWLWRNTWRMAGSIFASQGIPRRITMRYSGSEWPEAESRQYLEDHAQLWSKSRIAWTADAP